MRTRFELYAYPAFGNTAVDRIRRSDVTAVLEVLWTAKPAASRKLKQALGRVFVYALARDWITTTPGRRCVSQGLPRNKPRRPISDRWPTRMYPTPWAPSIRAPPGSRAVVFPLAGTHGGALG